MRDYTPIFEKSVRLVDADGYTITEREVNNQKEAKEQASYLLSPDYARSCETDDIGADHVELWVKGEHVKDYWK